MPRCFLLFSGGLDSILAAKILEEQKIKITPICFKSYFFGCESVKKSAENLGLKLKVVDISEKHLKIVKKPRYGLGKGMNPCIDCHLLMLKEAKKIMEKESKGAKLYTNFIATGDVLGERPFSQNAKALLQIEKSAGLKGKVLRPLSAKLLSPTIYEKKGIIDREKLFGIFGKSRKPQLALTKKFKIKEFPTPAGGCILTDLEYSKKLKKLFQKNPKFDGNDCLVLRRGRVFWEGKNLIVVARNEEECNFLKKLKKERDIIIEPKNFSGPTVLIRFFKNKSSKKVIKKGIELLLNYSKTMPPEAVILLSPQLV